MRKNEPWRYIPLDEVAESVVDGPFGSNLKNKDYIESGIPVIQGKNITGNKFEWKEIRFISPLKASGLMRSAVVLGDHLLVKIGSIGYSAILDNLNGYEFAIIPANLARVRPNRRMINDRYLHRYLTSEKATRYFLKVASKTAQPALSLTKIKALLVPLPPIEEQKRIAAILDAADALRAKRRESIAQLDALLQSTFLDMFGDPVTNPMGWRIAKIKNLVVNIDSGWSPLCLERAANEDEWGVLKLSAITSCEYREDQSKAFPDSLVPRSEIEVRKGDLLFSRKNTYDLVAACAYVHSTRPKLMLSDLIFRLRFAKEDGLEPSFFWQQLVFPRLRKKIQSLAGGAAGSMPNISKDKLRNVELNVPPLSLQRRFASIVEAAERQKARLRAHLDELDALFSSLQSRAFNGEL